MIPPHLSGLNGAVLKIRKIVPRLDFPRAQFLPGSSPPRTPVWTVTVVVSDRLAVLISAPLENPSLL